MLPDDVKAVAVPCLAHRLLLQPDQWVRGVRAEQVVAEVVSQVPAPAATDPGDAGPAPAQPGADPRYANRRAATNPQPGQYAGAPAQPGFPAGGVLGSAGSPTVPRGYGRGQ